MAEKFDAFSKHLASKQTRRGMLKFLGVGVIGAIASTVLSRDVDAARRHRGERTGEHNDGPQLNSTFPHKDYIYEYEKPHLNQTLP